MEIVLRKNKEVGHPQPNEFQWNVILLLYNKSIHKNYVKKYKQ